MTVNKLAPAVLIPEGSSRLRQQIVFLRRDLKHMLNVVTSLLLNSVSIAQRVINNGD